jgi:hypothetical protein
MMPPSRRRSRFEAEIIIDAVYDDIASVRVYSPWGVDFVHVVKARGDWKLFHVTSHRRDDNLT